MNKAILPLVALAAGLLLFASPVITQAQMDPSEREQQRQEREKERQERQQQAQEREQQRQDREKQADERKKQASERENRQERLKSEQPKAKPLDAKIPDTSEKQCKKQHVPISKISDGKACCVTPDTYAKLVERGWGS